MIHAIYGFIAAGKTTFARAVAEERGGVVMVLDEWLVALLGTRPDPEFLTHTIRVLRPRLIEHAVHLASAGVDVVLDFSFWSRRSRDELREHCSRAGVDVALYWLRASRETMRTRAIQRPASEEVFDIDAEAFDDLERRFEPLDGDEEHQVVETGG
ncbi:MAG: ATP-binding protein [Myxococcota bacterium]